MPNARPASSPHRLRLYAALGLILPVALAAAWRWTPLHELAEPREVAGWLGTLAQTGWKPVLILGLYIGLNAIMFPNTVLCLATILALGNTEGFLYATGGSLLAAFSAYLPARSYGPDRVKALRIRSVERVGEALKKGGVLHITTLRLLPLAPFNVINIMAGAAHVRPMPFLLGTFFGLLPGNLLFAVFGRQLRQMIAQPDAAAIALFLAVTLVLSFMAWYLHRLTLAPGRGRR